MKNVFHTDVTEHSPYNIYSKVQKLKGGRQLLCWVSEKELTTEQPASYNKTFVI
jgi:ribosome-associated toxin RatA of RatAB toxin-antitoxin module